MAAKSNAVLYSSEFDFHGILLLVSLHPYIAFFREQMEEEVTPAALDSVFLLFYFTQYFPTFKKCNGDKICFHV